MPALAAVVPGSAPYGAAELKEVYRRNFFVACCIAAALHLAIIGSYAGWLKMHPETARLAGIEGAVLVK